MVRKSTNKPPLEVVKKTTRRRAPAKSAKVDETAKPDAGSRPASNLKPPAADFDPVQNVRLMQETLMVDISAAIIDRIRSNCDWEMMPVDEQARMRQEARDMAQHVIQQCLLMVAGNGAPSAVGRCVGSSQTSKGDLQVKVVVSKENEMIPAILQSWGHDVYLVMQHGERFTDGVDRRQDQLV